MSRPRPPGADRNPDLALITIPPGGAGVICKALRLAVNANGLTDAEANMATAVVLSLEVTTGAAKHPGIQPGVVPTRPPAEPSTPVACPPIPGVRPAASIKTPKPGLATTLPADPKPPAQTPRESQQSPHRSRSGHAPR